VYEELQFWVKQLGLVMIEMTAVAHDRYLAETLFLTHYIAQTITAADFVRTTIDTVSFGFLMDAVESVRDDTALFADVFAYNQYCQATIDRLRVATNAVQAELQKQQRTDKSE
jgi:prephenate dehydrogenase